MLDDSCKTRFPIVLIHGVGFRDTRKPYYWGRIPRTLAQHGAQVFYGHQDSWGTAQSNAQMLAETVDRILDETGVPKVNLIAHSKGGIDARGLASAHGYGDKVASITTIASPHHGSKTMDALMRFPRSLFKLGAFAVDNWTRTIAGDKRPDFLAVCEGFTTQGMERFNQENPDVPGVFYQSYAFVMPTPRSDLALWFANYVLNRVEGPNDGLVSVESACWGENAHVLESQVRRGISHLDEIDFRRRAFPGVARGERGMDICDLYTGIAADLKARGL